MHRLAIAVVLAALTEPHTPCDQRRDLSARRIDKIDEDGLPVDVILAYLDRWRDRFWRFGTEAFWQLGTNEHAKLRNHPLPARERLEPLGLQFVERSLISARVGVFAQLIAGPCVCGGWQAWGVPERARALPSA
jgi:CRISPR-associated protein Cse1 (CRISPR_cse1)